jgi:hypothetical protein
MPRQARGFRKGALGRMMLVKGIVRAAMMGALAKRAGAQGRLLGGRGGGGGGLRGGGGRLRGFR